MSQSSYSILSLGVSNPYSPFEVYHSPDFDAVAMPMMRHRYYSHHVCYCCHYYHHRHHYRPLQYLIAF